MKTNEALSLTRHDQVWSLLPWYVNQTLSDDECMFVEQHLKECATCRGELKIQEKLCQGVRESVTENVCEQVHFTQLLQKIHARPQLETSGYFVLFSSFGAPAVAVAALLLLMLLLPFTGLFERTGVSYRTLTNPVVDQGGKPNDIRVIFEESLGDSQRQALLLSLKGAIIKPPDSNGVYVIRLARPEPLAPDKISPAIERLRQHPGIIFAEPVTITGS